MNAPAADFIPRATRIILGELVEVAQRQLLKPGSNSGEQLIRLHEELQVALKRFVEAGPRIQWEDFLLADTLCRLEAARGAGEITTRYAQVAGVLLPMVQENFYAAISARPAPIETTSTGRHG